MKRVSYAQKARTHVTTCGRDVIYLEGCSSSNGFMRQACMVSLLNFLIRVMRFTETEHFESKCKRLRELWWKSLVGVSGNQGQLCGFYTFPKKGFHLFGDTWCGKLLSLARLGSGTGRWAFLGVKTGELWPFRQKLDSEIRLQIRPGDWMKSKCSLKFGFVPFVLSIPEMKLCNCRRAINDILHISLRSKTEVNVAATRSAIASPRSAAKRKEVTPQVISDVDESNAESDIKSLALYHSLTKKRSQ